MGHDLARAQSSCSGAVLFSQDEVKHAAAGQQQSKKTHTPTQRESVGARYGTRAVSRAGAKALWRRKFKLK